MFGNGKVFVSHTHTDNAACAPVLAALDAWQVDYWFDLAQLSGGMELLDHIQRGLLDRDIFIRICTPATLASPWTAQEQTLARTLRAPNHGLRRMINLIVQPGYIVQPDEVNDITIDTTRQPEVVWMRQLREALEIPSRERRVSRRAVLGVGITSLAALGGLGLAGKLLFFTPLEPNRYLPIGHQPTVTPLPGASRIRWKFSIYPQPFFGTRTNIALAGKTIITAGNSTLTAVDGTNGTFLWIQRQYDINTDVPPRVVGNSIYVTYRDATYPTENSEIDKVYLAAFSVADGSLQWQQLVVEVPVTDNAPSASAIALDPDATTAYVRVNQTLYACKVETSSLLWRQSAGAAAVDLGEVLPAPTVAGDAVYAVLGDHKLHAFAATSGAALWSTPFATALPIHTRPVVANGLVYTGADGGWCYALDAATGTTRWKTQLLNPALVKPSDMALFTSLGLTLHDNVLYISGGFPFDLQAIGTTPPHFSTIQALDPTTGKILWGTSPSIDLHLTYSSVFRASPVVAGNSILMASALYPTGSASMIILYALNLQTGKVKWNLQVPGYAEPVTDTDGVPSAPVVSGDTLYLISGNEILYALSYGDNG